MLEADRANVGGESSRTAVPHPCVTLTTDFGVDSPYVAQMKGRLLTLCPGVAVCDITHAIGPQDIRAGARVLAETVPWFPQGTLHIAVVDPGVGTSRRLVYVEFQVLPNEALHRVLAPDNGLLQLLDRRSTRRVVIAVEDRSYWAEQVSATFHGRDILVPVAAHLLRGLDPRQLGPPIEKLEPLDWPVVHRGDRWLAGEVVAIDSFGNLITNIAIDDLPPREGMTDDVRIRCGTATVNGLVKTYGESPPGTLVALIGSANFLEMAVVNGNAARQTNGAIGTPVQVVW